MKALCTFSGKESFGDYNKKYYTKARAKGYPICIPLFALNTYAYVDLPAEIIWLIYRYRWQIELFFRWFKCILGCQHLLAQSQNGITIQVYCTLIASLLIRLWAGRKPTKRTFEMICLFFQGWATLDELIAHIGKLKSDNQK